VATGKRAIAYLQGVQAEAPAGVEVARNLEEASLKATLSSMEMLGVAEAFPTRRFREGQRQIRGLFCGGTLCQEAAAAIGASDGNHQFIDFGDDQYTQGRAHPMIDPTLRNQAIVQAGADPSVAIILLDVILGFAAHPDPAGATAPAIREAIAAAAADGREIGVVAHVVGTDGDPQDLARQKATLRSSRVHVVGSNIQAATAARRALERVAV
jgi:hypothetical protein